MSMAADWRANVLCRYFVNGTCRNGDVCPYSHDTSLARPRLPCKFYQRGTCAYGSRCQYLHESAARATAACDEVGALVSAPAVTTSASPAAKNTLSTERASQSSNSRDPATSITKKRVPKNWADAPEFVPSAAREAPCLLGSGTYSYSDAVRKGDDATGDEAADNGPSLLPLCPYAAVGECRYGETCTLLHGSVCDYCQCAVLHPFDKKQRDNHARECSASFEKDMEHSFRVASSINKTCDICMDVVLEKSCSSMQRFGILPNCNHCFCVTCIREWRARDEYEARVTRGCPVCRVHSDFMCPSRYWIDQPDQKKQLIDNYVVSCGKKPCRHFDEGRGDCPFGDKCFYQHKYPDGRIAQLGPPRRRTHTNILPADFFLLETEYLDTSAFDDAESLLRESVVRFLANALSSDNDDEEEEYYGDLS